MRILLIDIEVAPNTAHVWGIFDQNISINQLLESSYTLCYAAKWYGESKMYFDSVHKSSKADMLQSVHKLMDEADAIVHYNGSRFDIPILHKEFLLSGMPPPAPSKQIDLLQVARRQFRFVSNKLDYVAQALGLGSKTAHEGHVLWVKCMNDDRKAWKTMEEYNKNDVVLLEKVYDKFKGWIKSHPNHNAYSEEICCPNCGSRKLNKRGFAITSTKQYQRYQCMVCGSWSKSVKSEKKSKEQITGI
jgi:DNA polymerase elongation subunit (family B)